jgi:hypothetical protein
MTSATVGTMTLQDLKKQNKTLYDRALTDRSELVKDKAKMKSFLAEVDPFLDELTQLSGEVGSVEDFDWISDAALKWQLTLSTVLNVPHGPVIVSAPPILKSPKTPKFYTDQDLQKWFEGTAREQYLVRWRNLVLRADSDLGNLLRSTPEERAQDWHDTEILFASKVLEGGFHLTRQLSPDSYHRLESQWFDEVKRAKAYFIWENRQDKLVPPSRHAQDYLEAGRQLRSQLGREDLKASGVELVEVQEYLTHRYLTSGGTLDLEKPGATELVGRKAHQLWQTTREPDSTKNWTNASTYCRMFYENILPAVLAEDPESKRGHTLLALRAFQLSEAPVDRHQIINCFEVALAVYFLDAGIVKKLWADGALPMTSTL